MRVVWVSSAVLVLVLTLVLTLLTPSTAYIPPLVFTVDLSNTTTPDPDSSNDTTFSSDSTSTETTTSNTASTSAPTTSSTASTSTPTTSSTASTSAPTNTIGTDSSTSSIHSGLEVYIETDKELGLISDVLDNFAELISSGSAWSVQGARGHPASWWRRKMAAGRPLMRSYNFCVNPGANDLCNTLEAQMESTDNLVVDLRDDVNGWVESDLEQLRQEREGLEGTYDQATDLGEDFVKIVNKDEFIQAVDAVKQNVQDSQDAVQKIIDEWDLPDTTGSVALVATIGSIGGVMILSIIGVMIYSSVKQSKTKKKLSSGPKSKAKGENIPIDAYAQDAPVGPRAAPRVDPYSQPPAPAPQPHHYGPQYDPRRDPGFPDAMGGRPQRGLRRTNII